MLPIFSHFTLQLYQATIDFFKKCLHATQTSIFVYLPFQIILYSRLLLDLKRQRHQEYKFGFENVSNLVN